MERFFVKSALNIPNGLTLVRIALLPVIARCYLAGEGRAALGVYLLAMLTDVLDGVIARRTNQITALGKLLDPLADKLTLLTLLTLLCGGGQLPGWVLAVIAAKEAALLIGSVIALRRGIVVQALAIGKAATATFTAFVVSRLLGLTLAAGITMALSVVLSLLALVGYAANLALKMEQEKRASRRAAW